MTQEKLARVFATLAVGDVVSHPKMEGELIVLQSRPDGGKQLGIVCGCGKHVEGLPRLFYWNQARSLPVTTEDTPLLNWSDRLLVDKGAKEELADEFSCLVCEDDHEQAIKALKPDNADMDKISKVFSYSNSSTGHNTIAALKAIGIEIPPPKAAAFIAAMIAIEERDAIAGMLDNMFSSPAGKEIVGILKGVVERHGVKSTSHPEHTH